MGKEIERKFLVDKQKWAEVEKSNGKHIRQAYLVTKKSKAIRIRITNNSTAVLTLKGANEGISRSEFEYEIPISDALEIIDQFSEAELEKIRYKIEYDGKVWEVDEFLENNRGLILAEIELQYEDEEFSTPEWITHEVSDDDRYYNANLVNNPYKLWK